MVNRKTACLVIGLGRFGGAVAQTLSEMGREVLGVDTDARRVQHYSSLLTHTVEADTTNIDALEQLGATDFDKAIVAIGTDIEASILTTAALSDLKIGRIWAKAVSSAHMKILQRVGAHEVVFPENEAGQRLAHVIAGGMQDFIQLDEGFALVRTAPPRSLVGQTLAEAEVRKRYGITVVCYKRSTKPYTYATPETLMRVDDTLVVAGETEKAEAFAGLS